MQETLVWFLGQEDPLKKGWATHSSILGLSWWSSWWRIRLQCRRPGFDSWVGMILWIRGQLPTPVFWPGEFHGLYSPWGCKELDSSERLSLTHSGALEMLVAPIWGPPSGDVLGRGEPDLWPGLCYFWAGLSLLRWWRHGLPELQSHPNL